MSSPDRLMKTHFRVLDAWRGVAALLVALFHLNLYGAIYSLEFVRNAYLFVDFFFVLSGFVITHSYADRLGTIVDLRLFAIKRLGRLWPLHATVLLAFVVVESIKAALAARGASFYLPPFTGANSLNTLPMNLIFAQSFGLAEHLTWNAPSWSICAEFWTYLVFAVMLFVVARWFGGVGLATDCFFAFMVAGSFLALEIKSQHGIDASYDLGFVRCLYGFLVGHLTYRLFRVASETKFNAAALEWGLLIVLIAYVSLAGRTGYSLFAPLVFAAAVFVYAFEAGPVSRAMSNKMNDWLGKVSYSIYMWQAFVIFNFVDRPVSILEKVTGRVLTTTEEGVSSPLGGEAGKLIVLGGHWLPMLVTLVFLGGRVAIAGMSFYLVEVPGQRLSSRLSSWGRGCWPFRARSIGIPMSCLKSKDRESALLGSASSSPQACCRSARD
jgi:peptidoglycan/LPS O-acetylase OafA/YrhL